MAPSAAPSATVITMPGSCPQVAGAGLTAWVRHDLEPDAVAVVFLDPITADPEGIANALFKSTEPATTAK